MKNKLNKSKVYRKLLEIGYAPFEANALIKKEIETRKQINE